jgi:hypothetical protein
MDIEHDDRTQLERVAADGGRLPAAACNAGDFLNMIEDGQFSADVQQGLIDLAAAMSDHALATGGKSKVKGRVTITVDLLNEGGVFRAVGKFAVKAPEMPRRPTLLWTDEKNRFSRSQPRQGGFFGVRDVTLDKADVRTL